MKKCLLILAIVTLALPAIGQPFVFVFLNKKQRATELPKDQLDKIMEGQRVD